ncbi:MAG: glutaminyl-peptide cyclotransferase [Chromatocurvus sp.]
MSPLLAGLLLLAVQVVAVEAFAIERLGYRVLEQRAHPRENFVQGLEIVNGRLLVGTGQYGRSRLRRYEFDDMALIDERALHPRLFGEGITQFGDRIYQLTWRSRLGLVYRADDLRPLGRFRLRGEGWGITNNGEQLVYSDGSDSLRFLDPQTLELVHRIAVTRDGKPQRRLNELEWIEGRIWANVWQTDEIVIINPATGAVEGVLDLSGLLPDSARRPDTDVLNGIAYDRERAELWVTGKRWPLLYRVETVPAVSGEGAKEDASAAKTR